MLCYVYHFELQQLMLIDLNYNNLLLVFQYLMNDILFTNIIDYKDYKVCLLVGFFAWKTLKIDCAKMAVIYQGTHIVVLRYPFSRTGTICSQHFFLQNWFLNSLFLLKLMLIVIIFVSDLCCNFCFFK